MIKSVILIGTESTGKTALAKQLSDDFEALFVPEYARIYLEKKKELGLITAENMISKEDVAPIAIGQLNLETTFLSLQRELLFFDTSILMTLIYSRYYFNYSPKWLEDSVSSNKQNQLVLFLQPDIPFKDDPQRGSVDDRLKIHFLIQKELQTRNMEAVTIQGADEIRTEKARREVRKWLLK